MIHLHLCIALLLLLVAFHITSSFSTAFVCSSRSASFLSNTVNRAERSCLHQAKPQEDNSIGVEEEKPYFLRRALMADLSAAAQILADGFYDDRNIASKWWEKLQTQMSLESNLPTFASKNPQHEMWVACQKSNGQVLAFCEVDNREKDFLDNATKPYMCNLAVHLDHRGKGLAKEMIRQCEDTADLWKEEKLFLKVREHNEPAVQLYKTMGYDVVATQTDQKTDDTLLVMKRAWEWRPLIMNTAEEEEGIAVADDSSSRLDAAANMTLKQ